MTQSAGAKKLALFPIVLLVVAVITYAYPRLLMQIFEENSPWISYFYLYGNGLIFFCIGLWVILSSGACQLGRGRDSFWFGVLVFGFVFFATLHGVWVLLAIHMPHLGGTV